MSVCLSVYMYVCTYVFFLIAVSSLRLWADWARPQQIYFASKLKLNYKIGISHASRNAT